MDPGREDQHHVPSDEVLPAEARTILRADPARSRASDAGQVSRERPIMVPILNCTRIRDSSERAVRRRCDIRPDDRLPNNEHANRLFDRSQHAIDCRDPPQADGSRRGDQEHQTFPVRRGVERRPQRIQGSRAQVGERRLSARRLAWRESVAEETSRSHQADHHGKLRATSDQRSSVHDAKMKVHPLQRPGSSGEPNTGFRKLPVRAAPKALGVSA